MFVAIEGPNGVGKSSVAAGLRNRLVHIGQPAICLRQPSDSPLGTFIRVRHNDIRGVRLAALVVADRYLQIEAQIEPALEAGITVLVDRYVASTLVLQRMDGLSPDFLMDLNADVRTPDLTVILLGSPEILTARLDERGRTSRFEESRYDAELEVRYFKDASEMLTRAGYRVLRVDTDSTGLESVIDVVAAEIDTLK